MGSASAPHSFLERIRDAACLRLSVDTRALAAFRVTLALVVLVDLTMRARDLRIFYTDDGVLPRETLAELFPALASFSLHALSGGLVAQYLLFAVAALFALALLIGYRSRTSAFVSFVLLASLYARNPFVLNGGDTMLLVLLLLASMLPMGARWSVDSASGGGSTDAVFSVPGVAALLFLVVIYASNAVLRYRGELWMSGDAVRTIFGLESVTVLLGPYLAEMPALLVGINWAWVVLLTISPLLLVLTGWLRATLAGAFVAAHVGMALTLRLGVFPFVVIAALLLFLPPVFWDRVESLVSSGDADRVPDLLVSSSRYHLTPEGARRAVSLAVPFVAAFLLVTVLFWQGAALGYVDVPAGDTDANPEEYAWKMYAPTPPQTDGWYVVPVRFESGESVDGFHRAPVDYDAPPDLADAYPTTLWDRYLSEMRYSPETQRRAFAEYVCASASDHYGEPVRSVEVHYVELEVDIDADGWGDEERVELLEHDCS